MTGNKLTRLASSVAKKENMGNVGVVGAGRGGGGHDTIYFIRQLRLNEIICIKSLVHWKPQEELKPLPPSPIIQKCSLEPRYYDTHLGQKEMFV